MPLTLSGTTGIAGVDGSAGTPALRGTDTNTGIVFGSDTLSLATGGNSAALTVDANSNVTFPATTVMGSSFLRNRIINGDMRIDQRNAGASVTPTDAQFSVDRWACRLSQASKYSVQQNAGSITPPVGFTNYLGVTSLSSYSVGAGDNFNLQYRVEGYDSALFAWGTASAKTVTMSFWVYSSLTGTFGGSLVNANADRSYPFSYSIASANTWTYVSVVIPGDTSGTWNTGNGRGIQIQFGLGVGSTYSASAGSWTGAYIISATGATSVVGTNGATFYITGVQLEVGSVATPFERELYSQTLLKCQRYYYRQTGGDAYQLFGFGKAYSTGTINFLLQPPVTMRVRPTSMETSAMSTFAYETGATTGNTPTSISINTAASSPSMMNMDFVKSGAFSSVGAFYYILANNTSGTAAYVGFSAEL